MSQTEDFSKYPLPAALTRRVVTYLNVFRLFISFALTIAFFTGLLVKAYFLDTGAIAGTILISYFVMAVYLDIESRRRTAQHFFLAQISLFTDILFLSTLYFNAPNGIAGNEDCGQMSAWYILNAIGFYSFCPGSPSYSIGRPIFDEVSISLMDGKTFDVSATNNSRENKYIQSVRLNGEPLRTPFFTHEQIIRGGKLELEMGGQPNQHLFSDR